MRSRRLILLAALTAALLTFPATAAFPSAIPEGAIPLEGGGYALELKAPTPDWYTDELHEQVVAAGAEGVPIPDGVELPQSGLAFTGIRPGAWMIFPSWCTMNFVFGGDSTSTTTTKVKGNAGGKKTSTSSGGSSGWYIGTAGHCTEVGDEVTLIAAPGVLMNIGKTVKSVDQGIGRDFALIEIYPEMVQYVNPSMTYFGGPNGVNNPAVGDPVLHAGHGVGVGTGGTPRAGLVTYVGKGDNTSQTAYGWDGAASPGDSGSAVRHADGRAEGNLTHLVVGGEYVPAIIAGTTAPYMEALAGKPICYAPVVPNPLPAPTCAP
ncbi:MAG TPA: hypothetical protein VM307_10390 [Egibacteraceae bacterium]|nr:hypothetical protein [Egibacteraceae bacterium]